MFLIGVIDLIKNICLGIVRKVLKLIVIKVGYCCLERLEINEFFNDVIFYLMILWICFW